MSYEAGQFLQNVRLMKKRINVITTKEKTDSKVV